MYYILFFHDSSQNSLYSTSYIAVILQVSVYSGGTYGCASNSLNLWNS